MSKEHPDELERLRAENARYRERLEHVTCAYCHRFVADQSYAHGLTCIRAHILTCPEHPACRLLSLCEELLGHLRREAPGNPEPWDAIERAGEYLGELRGPRQ